MILDVLYDESSVEIEGTAQTLREFAQRIEECTGHCDIQVAMPSGSNDRGLHRANAVTIQISAGPVNISPTEDRILISGSKVKLLVLVQNILWLADNDTGGAPIQLKDHIHIEYHPDHFFLAEGALPVVVTKA